jgi:hypothetical protein
MVMVYHDSSLMGAAAVRVDETAAATNYACCRDMLVRQGYKGKSEG